ncbi:MAG: hypothetical protein H7240_00775 [Glaciimonas sp.]|nr:hypothetical protein [Glaciimonas sp.]
MGEKIYLGRFEEESVVALMALGRKELGFNVYEHVVRSTGVGFDNKEANAKLVFVFILKSNNAPIIQTAAQSITHAILSYSSWWSAIKCALF